MFLVKLFSVISLINVTSGSDLFHGDDPTEKISSFVEILMNDLKNRNSMTHDVALLKLGLYKDSQQQVDDIYASVVSRLSKTNPVITPDLSKISKTRDMKKAAMTIIVSDVYDAVRKCVVEWN